MSLSKLIFFPADYNHLTDTQVLLNALLDCDFIGTKPHANNHYLPGENFLSLITFLGCSPNINLQPVEGESHCYISLIKATAKANVLGYTNSLNPKCPACKKRIANWKTEGWQQAQNMCSCDKCQSTTEYAKLNWKQECGYARCGFEVAHIYPHEAVPTDQLLAVLKSFSGIEWDYCYSNN